MLNLKKMLGDAEKIELLCGVDLIDAQSKENVALHEAMIAPPEEADNAQIVLDNRVQVTAERKDAMESATEQVILIHKKMVDFVKIKTGVDTKTAVEALYRSYYDIDDAIAQL